MCSLLLEILHRQNKHFLNGFLPQTGDMYLHREAAAYVRIQYHVFRVGDTHYQGANRIFLGRKMQRRIGLADHTVVQAGQGGKGKTIHVIQNEHTVSACFQQPLFQMAAIIIAIQLTEYFLRLLIGIIQTVKDNDP